jgi:PIN domain nuclease of toxin-antitoxin system
MSQQAPMTNKIYVADTHALLWHLFDPSRLSTIAFQSFQEVGENEALLHLPAVVVAEALMIIEKKRIQGTLAQFEHLLQQMSTSDNYQIGQLDLTIVLKAAQYTQLKDIFDRLIVAEADSLNAPLISRDADITASNLVPLIW